MSNLICLNEIVKKYGISKSTASRIIKKNIQSKIIIDNMLFCKEDEFVKALNYYDTKNCYSWNQIAKMFNLTHNKVSYKNYILQLIPYKKLGNKYYFDKALVDDIFSNPQKYDLKINLKHNPTIYKINSMIDVFYTKYFTINDFRIAFQKKYHIQSDLKGFNRIPGLAKKYQVEKFDLIDDTQYGIKKEFLNNLLDEYYQTLILRNENDYFEHYNILSKPISDVQKYKFKETLHYLEEFLKVKLNGEINKQLIYKTHSLREYLVNNLEKEIFQYNNDEILSMLKDTKKFSYLDSMCSQFIKYLHTNYPEKCVFNIDFSSKVIGKQKNMNDFYSPIEWTNYVNFIFDIEHHIEKAFSNYYYARYWLFCMLQCSLAWRREDILSIPALSINVNKYSLSYFETHEFTKSEAYQILSNAKLFIEQDPVHKTGAKKHFIIMNSFTIGTAIGMIICEQFRTIYNNETLFGNFSFKNSRMVEQLGPQIKGFSNLKACRTILSFANEINSNNENSSKAINISSYMRSHIVDERGLSNTTEIYLKSKYDEKELLSIPSKMNEIGLFGWLYKDVLECIDEKTSEHQVKIIKDEVSPIKLDGYANFLLNEQRNRKDVFKEVIAYDKEFLYKILEGKNVSKVRDICCVKKNCPYPTSDKCELCKYAIPTVHALHLIGQETLEVLERLQTSKITIIDRNKYSYQLFKLLLTLKEAKEELGIDFVNTFASYEEITIKVALLQKGENQ